MINNNFYTLSAVVEMCLADAQETQHRYQQFLRWAIWQYREFNFDTSQQIKGAKLSMNDVKAIELPLDFVDWVRVVGIVDGKATVLDVNMDIPLVSSVATKGNYDAIYSRDIKDFFHNYGQFQRNGVQPWTSKGHFRMDKDNNQILFSSTVTTGEIYLEYIGDGIEPGRDTIVNPYIMESLRQYVHFQRIRFSKTANQYDKEQAKREFVEAKSLARSRIFAFSIGEYTVQQNLQAQSPVPFAQNGDFSSDFSSDFENSD
jgi:hypothetical protein